MIGLFKKRFEELTAQLAEVEATVQRKHGEFVGTYQDVDAQKFLNWCVKACNILSRACGIESQHFMQFQKREETPTFTSNYDKLKELKAVFLAAKEDYEGGYLVSARNLIQAEVFDDQLEQASELLETGYDCAAAVVAGVVLETTLRNLCSNHGIPQGKLDRMNAELAKRDVYNKLKQKQITAWANIRNSAAHGKAGEFNHDDVKSMIPEIKRFVSDVMSYDVTA